MFRRIAIAIDQLFNTLAGGYEDETLSSRAYRLEQRGSKRWHYIRKGIDWWMGAGHCRMAFAHEKQQYKAPRELK